MTSRPESFPVEVQQALDDLQRIKEVIHTSQDTHPIRLIMRPLMLFAALQGPFTLAYGLLSQWLLDTNQTVAGLSPTSAVWLLSFLLFVSASIVKIWVINSSSRKVGYNVGAIYRALFTGDWARLVLPVFGLMMLASVALASLDGEWMIVGVLTFGAGALWFAYTAIFPLREFTSFGLVMMSLGVVATFTYPEWSFVKFALIWGVCVSLAGLLLYRRFPPLTKLSDAANDSDEGE